MDLTNGTRTTAAVAATVTAGGLSTVLYGIIRNDLARSIGGLCFTVTALTAIALVLIWGWVTDTRDERRILAAAQREAVSERGRYFAAQAALENEQGRLNRDMAAERHALSARLKTERDKLAEEFEERRASVIAETMEATVLMIRDGKLAPDQAPAGNLIPFPPQQPQRHPGREQSREHGVVGP